MLQTPTAENRKDKGKGKKSKNLENLERQKIKQELENRKDKREGKKGKHLENLEKKNIKQ